jgi:preprotein translocase subunit SecA
LFGATLLHKHLKQDDLEGGKWTPVSTGAMGEDIFDFALSNGETIYELVEKLYNEREEQLGAEYLRSIERWQVTRSIDEYWMEHLAAMDYLRDALWQESYAQKEPIGVYRQEGFAMFQRMLAEIRQEVTAALFAWQTQGEEPQETAALEIGDMHEARLIQDFPMDEDDLEDGEQLIKDADGQEPELVHSGRSGGAAVATPQLARPVASPMRREQREPMSRAERRAAEKNAKKRH